MSERVPKGWEISPLGNLASVNWGNTSLTKASYVENGFPAFSAAGNDGLVTNAEHNSVGIVLSAIGARCGRTFLTPAKWTAIKNTIAILTDDQDIRYLFHVFNFDDVWNKSGGAQPFISLGDARKTPILHPPLPEQKKIASILTSVDEVIETTQRQIDKLQDLKKATMNELLTKGIGHTEFKDSELGGIPKSWDEITFKNALNLKIIEEIQDGNHGAQHPKASDYTESGVPFVMARDLKDGQIDLTNICYIPKTIYQKLRIGFAVAGDILLTHKATIGVIAIVQEGTPEVMCTPQVTYYRVGNGSILNNVFLFYWFQSDIFQNELSRLSGQSTRSYIGITAQKDLFLRLPPMDEQRKIIDVFKSIDQKLKLQKEKLSQTQSLKKSLMQDLLTGKVRVEVN